MGGSTHQEPRDSTKHPIGQSKYHPIQPACRTPRPRHQEEQMSTRESNPPAARRLHTALDRGLVTLGALVAIRVMVLFLGLAGAKRNQPARSVTATHPSTGHVTPTQPRAPRHHQQQSASKRHRPPSPSTPNTRPRKAPTTNGPSNGAPLFRPAETAAAADPPRLDGIVRRTAQQPPTSRSSNKDHTRVSSSRSAERP